MKIEDQCCSYELSIKLKELGVKQDSLFYWTINDLALEPLIIIITRPSKTNYSAFTSDKLMDMLPAVIDTKNNEPFNFFWLKLIKRNAKNIQYVINYDCDTISYGDHIFKLSSRNIYDEKLADCLAKMLIYLIENKFIEVKTC